MRSLKEWDKVNIILIINFISWDILFLYKSLENGHELLPNMIISIWKSLIKQSMLHE